MSVHTLLFSSWMSALPSLQALCHFLAQYPSMLPSSDQPFQALLVESETGNTLTLSHIAFSSDGLVYLSGDFQNMRRSLGELCE